MYNSELVKKVRATAERFDMISDDDTIIVGLSGGADSTALLCVLCELRSEYGLTLIAAHLNHGIRGAEADRDEAFCKKLCKKLNVKIYAFHLDVPALAHERGVSEEVAGRDARYEFFTGLVGKDGKIATAHNAQDNAETFILNLSRGTGLKGLCGIPPVRFIEHSEGCKGSSDTQKESSEDCASKNKKMIKTALIRPLIECRRDEIEDYLKERGQDFVTDSTNFENEYNRNRVRHNVISELNLINENAIGNITRCISNLTEDNEFLEALAADLLSSARLGAGYDTKTLLDAPKPVLSRALLSLVFDACGRYPEKVHILKSIDMMEKGRTDQIQIPGGHFIRVERGLLTVINKR